MRSSVLSAILRHRACFGLLHLFDDLDATLSILKAQVAAGGSVYATSLIAATPIGRRALALLRRAGEAAAPGA